VHRPHALHAADRIWPQSNCYVDLWIELLNVWGLQPEAALPFTVTLDFEGDQFTFFKPPSADLEYLYGTVVQELALYDELERHVALQAARGRVVLLEVDSFFLPDTRSTSYRSEHTKTTIGVLALDSEDGRCRYLHNAGCYDLDGSDFFSLFRMPRENGLPLLPYAEMVKRPLVALDPEGLAEASLTLLRQHLRRRPASNPLTAFRDAFAAQLDRLLSAGMGDFHRYAFNTFRQLGSNFELLGSYADWLEGEGAFGLDALRAGCTDLAQAAKALQFRTARLVSRQRHAECGDSFDALERAYDAVMHALTARLG